MTRLLFVCTGNICRSPTAEGVMRAMLTQRGLQDVIAVDSAGTNDYHTGERPDSRSRETARQRGIDLNAIRARVVEPDDFDNFDYILAMDRSHLKKLCRMTDARGKQRVHLFLSFLDGDNGRDVQDPYYGGPQGFENTFDLVESGCQALLEHILSQTKA